MNTKIILFNKQENEENEINNTVIRLTRDDIVMLMKILSAYRSEDDLIVNDILEELLRIYPNIKPRHFIIGSDELILNAELEIMFDKDEYAVINKILKQEKEKFDSLLQRFNIN